MKHYVAAKLDDLIHPIQQARSMEAILGDIPNTVIEKKDLGSFPAERGKALELIKRTSGVLKKSVNKNY